MTLPDYFNLPFRPGSMPATLLPSASCSLKHTASAPAPGCAKTQSRRASVECIAKRDRSSSFLKKSRLRASRQGEFDSIATRQRRVFARPGPEPDIRRAGAGKGICVQNCGSRSTRLSAQDDRLAARSRSTRSVTSRAIATEPSTSLSVSPLTIAKVISTYSLRPLLCRARVSVGRP